MNEYLNEYIQMKEEAAPIQRCLVCGISSPKDMMHPHHVSGRSGIFLLKFSWAHPLCHQLIHQNPEMAKKRGWIVPQFETERKEKE